MLVNPIKLLKSLYPSASVTLIILYEQKSEYSSYIQGGSDEHLEMNVDLRSSCLRISETVGTFPITECVCVWCERKLVIVPGSFSLSSSILTNIK